MTQLSIFAPQKTPLELMIEELRAEGQDPDRFRYYQRDCYDATLAAFELHNRVLTVLATGLGKTEIFTGLTKHWDGNVLVLAERDELVMQARDRLEKAIDQYVSVEKAEQTSLPRDRVVVGSVQSFGQKRLDRLGRDRFQLVVIDEAHHSVAPSYRRIIDWFRAKFYGTTATPDRADEKALGQVWDEVAFVMDIQEGIEAGFLVPILGRQVEIKDVDLDTIGTSKGDFNVKELDLAMLKSVEGIVQKTLEIDRERPAICFFPGVRSAELAAQRFNAQVSDSAAFVDGFTDKLERKRIMRDFKAGRIKYLCNCQVATEGFDAPNASMIVQGRPTMSRSLHAQMTGRGTRTEPGLVDQYPGRELAYERREAIAKSSKPDLLVLDFVGNCTKRDLVTVTDVLGGNYTPAEVKEAKKKVRAGENVGEALAQARRELKMMAERAAESKAKVTATVTEFDPFRTLGLKMADQDRYANRFGATPATPKQIAFLIGKGVPKEECNQLSKRAANRLKEVIFGRMKHGLCTYKQLRQLQRFGVTDLNITYDRARAALDYIGPKMGWPDRNGFRDRTKMGIVDPKVVHEIINHRRAAGED